MQKGRNEAPSKKVKILESAGKVMATVSWDSKMVLLINYLPFGTTLLALRLCEVLTQLRRVI